MRKWIAMLLTAVLTAGLLTGCQPTFKPTYPEGVTKEKLEAISAEYDIAMSWYHIEGYGAYYLGHENGYDIFYESSFPVLADWAELDLFEVFTCKIGSASFYPCPSTNLLVYKDRAFRNLGDCYNEGLISEDAILLAKERFDEYMQILKNMEHDVYWQREKQFILKYYKEVIDLDPGLEKYLNGSESREYLYLQKLFQAAASEE